MPAMKTAHNQAAAGRVAMEPPLASPDTEAERRIFARNFRLARREAKLSQREVHRLTGIAQSHVSEIETAQVNICLDTIVKLARLVRKPVHELFKP
jgi:DNA-binding XRE family transcriptional regulator